MNLNFFLAVTIQICGALSLKFDLIDQYYGNSEIGELILSGLDEEADPLTKIVKYKQFFDKMLQYDGLYSIAGTILGYKVNQLRKTLANTELDYIMWNLLPEIKQIPWNKPVTLHNMNGKYLRSANYNVKYRHSFSDISTVENLDANCYWILNIKDNGDYFTIQNHATKQFLFAAGKLNSDRQRRKVTTVANVTIVNKSDRWQLEPVRNKTLQYRIKNVCWGEYLFSVNNYDAVTWKRLGCEGSKCHWRFETEPSELPVERQDFLSKYYNDYPDNDHIMNKLLKLASNSSTQITEYRNLYNLMKEHNDFYTIAGMQFDYNLHKLHIENPNNPDLEFIEENVRKLWKPFPWDKPIMIQNVKTSGYLCSTKKKFKKTNYDALLMHSVSSCEWKIEAELDGEMFRLKTIKNNKILRAVPDYNYDESQRGVFTTNNTEPIMANMALWQFEHELRSDHVVRIKNAFWHEFLSSDGKGIVFTRRQFGCDDDYCLWRIHHASN